MEEIIVRTALIALLTGLVLNGSPTAAQTIVSGGDRTGLGLTIYSDGFGVVREKRRAVLPAGRSRFRLTGISPGLQPETVRIDLPDTVTLVSIARPLETLTPAALLKAAVGKPIRWLTNNPVTGKDKLDTVRLVSLAGGIVIERAGRFETNPPGRPVFDSLPVNLSGEPVLDVTVVSSVAGAVELDIAYLTGGLAWRANYVATLDDAAGRFRFEGFAGITNTSGIDYDQAAVSLIAGAVRRVSVAPVARERSLLVQSTAAFDVAPSVPSTPGASAVGDYRRYDLAGTTSLPDGVAKQIRLFDTFLPPVRKVYRLAGRGQFIGRPQPGGPARLNPAVELVFRNAGEAGTPLPAGIVRVYASPGDAGDRIAVLLGEDRIAHTPVGEEVRLSIGQAFDIVAERVQTKFKSLGNRGEFESSHEITIRNRKSVGVTVEVSELLYGQWRITGESQRHVRKDARTAVWNVSVPAGGETVLSFSLSVRP